MWPNKQSNYRENKIEIWTDLLQEIDEFEGDSKRLSSELKSTATQLELDTLLPDISLIEQLQKLDHKRREICIQGEIDPDLESSFSIAEIRKILQEKILREGETGVLYEIQELVHVEGDEFAPLKEIKQQAKKSIDDVKHLNFNPESLKTISGKYNRLLNFIKQADTLNDDEWTSQYDELLEGFSKALIIAAARGKLSFETSPQRP